MSNLISDDYFIGKLYETASRIKHNSRRDEYNCECPFCNESSQRGRARRFYYYGESKTYHCFNCGAHGNQFKYLQDVCNISWKDIKKNESATNINFSNLVKREEPKDNPLNYDLPDDAINLCDVTQLRYHKRKTIVKIAITYLQNRRLYSAKYRPKTFWLSLNDFVQKDRLIIPFYDENGKIPFYQSRKLLEEGNPAKYISKYGADKTLFNLNKIDNSFDKIFLLEGPIDACFLKNAVGITGIAMTEQQKEQLQPYFLHDKIWVLDNQWCDEASRKKTRELVELGERVFIWPEELKKYKDINDYCIEHELDEFDHKKILDNIYQGFSARIALSKIRD